MSHNLPEWLQRLFGVPSANPGEGTVYELTHSWNLAPWLTLLFCAGIMAFVIACILREPGGAGRIARSAMIGLRLTAILLVGLMLADFVLRLHRTGLPTVVIMIDESASMALVDRHDDTFQADALQQRLTKMGLDEPHRLNFVKSVLLKDNGELLRGLEKRYRLKLYFFSRAAQEQSGGLNEELAAIRELKPTGEATKVGSAIRDVLNDQRGTLPSAIILFTDGINTEGDSLAKGAEYASLKGVPLYPVAIGSPNPVKDLELTDMLVDEVVFLDDVVNFEAKLTGTGLEGKDVRVILREENSEIPLAEVTIRAGADRVPEPVRIPYRPTKVGEFQYVMDVIARPEESTTQNNRLTRTVSVRKEQIKVLAVQSGPSYEFRFLKHMLERDNTISLKLVLQEADPRYSEIDRSALRLFPLRREELFEYDVIIFGDVDPAFLSGSSLENVADFVKEKGGGLIVISGEKYTPHAFRGTPLTELLPIELSPAEGNPNRVFTEPFTIRPTDLGLVTPHLQLGENAAETAGIWGKFPSMYWNYDAAAIKPTARGGVLAEHSSRLMPDGSPMPLIVMHFVGAGKVIFHGTDETYRWRFRIGDFYFSRYWVQTVRYLSRSKLLGKDRAAEVTADRHEYMQGEPVRLRVRFTDERVVPAGDEGVTLVLEQESDQRHRVSLARSPNSPSIFEGIFGRSLAGKYHAWLETPRLEGEPPACDFVVAAPPGELENVQTDLAAMEQAANISQGKLLTLAQAENLLEVLPEGRQIKTEHLPPLGLWKNLIVKQSFLGLMLLLLVSEWVLRKTRGML